MSAREAADLDSYGRRTRPLPSPFPEGKVMTFPSHRGGYVAAFTVALSTLALISTAPAHAASVPRAAPPSCSPAPPTAASPTAPPATRPSRTTSASRASWRTSPTPRTSSTATPTTPPTSSSSAAGARGGARHAVDHGRRPSSRRTAWAAPRPTGRRRSPALDGDSHHAPHCVAFVSAASNLVPGDTNGQPDAFVRDLRTSGTTTRVSVDSRRRARANGTTYEVSIDGDCERVAFTLGHEPRPDRAPDRWRAAQARATSRSTCTS